MDGQHEVEVLVEAGIRLHIVEHGLAANPPVILLHGFPEFWWGWRHQISPLVGAGYRVLVPDQRGYNLSDKPQGLRSYRIDYLAKDVLKLIEWSGHNKAFLIGHDWGGLVAWTVAALFPQHIGRLVVINAPYPRLSIRDIVRSPYQFIRSSYIYFFQIPWLPEWLLSRKNWSMLADSLSRTSRSGTFSSMDQARYREAWSQPGAITGMLNWYRALARQPWLVPPSPSITPPTCILWGAQDFALGKTLAEASYRLCKNGELWFHPRASHWVQHEEPDWVNRHILRFLQLDPKEME